MSSRKRIAVPLSEKKRYAEMIMKGIVNLQNHAFSELSHCRDLSLRDNLINDIMPNVFKGFGNRVPEISGGRKIIDLRNNELYTILDDWV
ncbi:unnamed protein product [Oikopleura dioica]|uniref:Uncharacterized protein n=1 Tax=Oikopleura dioica TaxID=34765 RepID=E4YE08_OIKDI|nr:unnamed protein product [Oikopleura dioica]